MAQFDVYENPNPATSEIVPYLLDLQSDLLDDLATRVVAPLVTLEGMELQARFLNPVFTIGERQVVMSTAELAGISRRDLGDRVTSLIEERDRIIGALDFLFTGF
ncbi:MAG: CcdB family protein [Proteobacteria bacterium]|nr:CcdB family protein [Pseudomonadota bacterium]MBU1736637.1 CcdB family protein [Pseudomonadota bacterium]